ncbi:MAG: hypothetical protein ACP5HM_16175, partial [Anaerolineae bacterium]
MWTIAQYQPTAFFSLRASSATSSGGKSLIVPTPYAIKTALMDAAIRTQGLAHGKALFKELKALSIAIQLPEQIVVNNTFTKILRVKEIKTRAAEKESAIDAAMAQQQWPYQSTIAFREYVQFGGPLCLAFEGLSEKVLTPLLTQINYLGKRGGFLQLRRPPATVASLPEGFTLLTDGFGDAFPLGTLQVVDDWGPRMTFDHLNTYSDKSIRTGSHRIFHQIVLPHRPVQSSRNYTLYA